MKKKKAIGFVIWFAMLLSFSLASLGLISPGGAVSVYAAEDGGTYVQVYDSMFEAKVLSFIREEKVCSLTDEQATALSQIYPTEEQTYDVNGNEVNVLYVQGNPLNKEILEYTLGTHFEGECQVVHGNKIIAALVTPIFVS